jgi:hypothetical protein
MLMKLLIIFLMLVLSAISAYAGPRDAFSVDVGPTAEGLIINGWGLGFTYEAACTSNISLMGRLGFVSAYFSMITPGIEGHWYFLGQDLTGFYAGLGIDYNFIAYSGGSAAYPGIGAYVGWKILSQPSRGPVLEPYLGYDYLIGNNQQIPLSEFEVKYGIRLGYSF